VGHVSTPPLSCCSLSLRHRPHLDATVGVRCRVCHSCMFYHPPSLPGPFSPRRPPLGSHRARAHSWRKAGDYPCASRSCQRGSSEILGCQPSPFDIPKNRKPWHWVSGRLCHSTSATAAEDAAACSARLHASLAYPSAATLASSGTPSACVSWRELSSEPHRQSHVLR